MIKVFLMLTGAAALIMFVVMLIRTLYLLISEKINDIRWEYTYKHRFDKPPTAACYCRDCVYHGIYNSADRCRYNNIGSTGDSWFCADAAPRKRGDDEKNPDDGD